MSSVTNNASVIRLLYCDVSGLRRCRVTILPKTSTTITKACVGLPYYGDICLEDAGVNAVGEYLMSSDENTIQSLPWRPNHLLSHVLFSELDTSDNPFCCLRSRLRETIDTLGKNITCNVGFDIQFQIFHDQEITLNDSMHSFSDLLDETSELNDSIIYTLTLMGIKVQCFTPGGVSGQFKISLMPEDILKAADNVLYAKEAISAIARKHGKFASFLSLSPFEVIGSGCECRLTFRQVSKEVCEQFAGSISEHYTEMMPFIIGSPLNFLRFQSASSKPPVRISKLDDDFTIHVNIFDGTANPHLALIAMIAVGKDGLDNNRTRFNNQTQNSCEEIFTGDELSTINQIQFLPDSNYFSDSTRIENEFKKKWEDLIQSSANHDIFNSELLRMKIDDQLYKFVVAIKKSEINEIKSQTNIIQHLKQIALRY